MGGERGDAAKEGFDLIYGYTVSSSKDEVDLLVPQPATRVFVLSDIEAVSLHHHTRAAPNLGTTDAKAACAWWFPCLLGVSLVQRYGRRWSAVWGQGSILEILAEGGL